MKLGLSGPRMTRRRCSPHLVTRELDDGDGAMMVQSGAKVFVISARSFRRRHLLWAGQITFSVAIVPAMG